MIVQKYFLPLQSLHAWFSLATRPHNTTQGHTHHPEGGVP